MYEDSNCICCVPRKCVLFFSLGSFKDKTFAARISVDAPVDAHTYTCPASLVGRSFSFQYYNFSKLELRLSSCFIQSRQCARWTRIEFAPPPFKLSISSYRSCPKPYENSFYKIIFFIETTKSEKVLKWLKWLVIGVWVKTEILWLVFLGSLRRSQCRSFVILQTVLLCIEVSLKVTFLTSTYKDTFLQVFCQF